MNSQFAVGNANNEAKKVCSRLNYSQFQKRKKNYNNFSGSDLDSRYYFKDSVAV